MLLHGGVGPWRTMVLQPTAARANGRAAWRAELAGGHEVWLYFSTNGEWHLQKGALDAGSKTCNAHIARAAEDEGLPMGTHIWRLARGVRGVARDVGEDWKEGTLTMVTGETATAAQVS